MPIQVDAPFVKFDDGILVVTLQPSIPIGGQNYQFECQNRFGGVSGRIVKSMASGRYNVSGMNIVNSGQGVMNVTIDSANTSGLQYGNYAFTIQRLDSGNRSTVTEGYILILP